MKRNVIPNCIAIGLVCVVPLARLWGACLIQKPIGTACPPGPVPIYKQVWVGLGWETVSCEGTTTDHFPDIDIASNSGRNSFTQSEGTDCHYSCIAQDSTGNEYSLSSTPGNL